MDSLALYTARSNTPQQFHPKPRKNYQNLFCDFYSIRGHSRADCNKLKKCDHCHVTGHIKENCFLLIGYPENFKGKRRANAVLGGGDQHFQQQSSHDHALLEGSSMMQRKAHTTIGEHKSTTQEQLLQLMHDSSPEQLHQMIDTIKKHKNIMDTPSNVNMAGTSHSLKWIIDTGETDHMINNPNYLHVKTKVGGVGKVQLLTGDLATVSHVGNLQLSENDVIKQPNIITDPPYPVLDTETVSSDTEVEVISYVVSPQLPDVIRKSNRLVKPLLWHIDYVMSKQKKSASACLYFIADAVDYQSITPAYKSF
ncbi:hypothetical protein H5410_016911, partial [Solanum commersonii]